MSNYFLFLLIGYFATVMIELPVLWFGLAKTHTARERIFAAFWLTACTYPIVVLVLPQVMGLDQQRWLFLLVAESFAILTECALMMLVIARTQIERLRGGAAVLAANVLSFIAGESLYWVATPYWIVAS